MTAISTDKSHGAIYDLQVEEIPISSHGTAVTAVPRRLAIVHGNVDTRDVIDTLDLNTYVNGKVIQVRGLLSQAIERANSVSATWSGSTLTFAGHGAATTGATANLTFSALVEMA